MKLRNRVTSGKIALDMTPMIDVVFQLLIFFMCTLKVIEPEGDFDISIGGSQCIHCHGRRVASVQGADGG